MESPDQGSKSANSNLANRFAGPLFFIGILCIFGFAFWEACGKEVWEDRVTRPRQVAAEKAAGNALFEKQFGRDSFFTRLPPERQKAVRETILETIRWNKVDAEIENLDPKDLAYKDFGPGLKLDEVNWFQSKGLIAEPRWPGYKTYRTPEGIFILFPDRIIEEEHKNNDEEDDAAADDPF